MVKLGTGSNYYRNLVSCCVECNSQKGQRSAEDFLRALEALASGELRPILLPR